MAKTPIEQFLDSWISRNVHNVPGLSNTADLDQEIARLKAMLIADGAANGFSLDALEQAVGDFEDYLTPAYENVHDPDAGGVR